MVKVEPNLKADVVDVVLPVVEHLLEVLPEVVLDVVQQGIGLGQASIGQQNILVPGASGRRPNLGVDLHLQRPLGIDDLELDVRGRRRRGRGGGLGVLIVHAAVVLVVVVWQNAGDGGLGFTDAHADGVGERRLPAAAILTAAVEIEVEFAVFTAAAIVVFEAVVVAVHVCILVFGDRRRRSYR